MNGTEQSPVVGERPPLLDLGPFEELPELQLVVGENVQATPEAAISGQTDPWIEWKRTVASMNAANLAYASDDPTNYDIFAGRQSETVQLQSGESGRLRLTTEQFAKLGQQTRDITGGRAGLVVLLYTLATHDDFKNDDMYTEAGIDRNKHDHDEAIAKFFLEPQYDAIRRRRFPKYYEMNSAQQTLFLAMHGVPLNYGQEFQGETPAGTLAFLDNPNLKRQALGMKLLEGKFDIAGALGYRYLEDSLTLDSPTFQQMECFEEAILSEAYTNPVDRSNSYWRGRALLYGVTNFDVLDPKEQEKVMAFSRLSA